MGVLLAPDAVSVYDDRNDADEHGWAQPVLGDGVLVWSGAGSLQHGANSTAVAGAEGGSRGPASPENRPSLDLFLPYDPQVRAGMRVDVNGESYRIAALVRSSDPTGGHGLLCWRATVRPDVI